MRKIIFLLTVVFLLSGVASAEFSDHYLADDNQLKIIWLLIDRLSLEEIFTAHTPNIDILQQKGAFSLMNVRTAGHLDSKSTYLSANTGKRCQGSKMTHNAITYGKGAINDKITDLRELNKDNLYRPEPGMLGEMIRRHNINFAILGNSDTAIEKKRTVVSMFMDKERYVPRAVIGKDILVETDEPWGYRTDWQQMEEEFKNYYQRVDALVMETGDLSRIDDFQNGYRYLKKPRREALERIDRFIGYLLTEIDLKQVQIGLIIPTPPRSAMVRGENLSWVLFSGRDIEQGWISSTTTRRKGIITIQDLPHAFVGTARDENITAAELEVAAAKTEWADIRRLNSKISFIYRIRPGFIQAFIFVQLLIIVMAIIKMVSNKSAGSIIFNNIFEYVLLAVMLVPINYLIISSLYIFFLSYIIFILILITSFEVFVLHKLFNNRLDRVVFVSWLMVLIISLDLLAGYKLQADSILGYSSIIGARFYGLGNEYMGFFLGALIIAVTGSLELCKNRYNLFINKHFTIPFFIGGIYITGATNIGANFGGMVTALLIGGVTYFYLSGRKWKQILPINIIVFFTLLYLDAGGFLGQTSHIGRAVIRFINGEWWWLTDVVIRKLRINMKLLRWTIWSRVLLAFIIYLFVLARYPVAGIKRVFRDNSYLKAGFYGGLAGCLVTIIINDSGVVAAATLLFYPLMALLLL